MQRFLGGARATVSILPHRDRPHTSTRRCLGFDGRPQLFFVQDLILPGIDRSLKNHALLSTSGGTSPCRIPRMFLVATLTASNFRREHSAVHGRRKPGCRAYRSGQR
jgi:hypothetical protein